MKIDARLNLHGQSGPEQWEDVWGLHLPLDHIICRDVDGTPHMIREFVWPWRAYSKDQRKIALHFYYWDKQRGPLQSERMVVTRERESRIRELQFLMTRQLYYGVGNSPRTLTAKLDTLHVLACFAEARSCSIRDVLTDNFLLNAFGLSLPGPVVKTWLAFLTFLRGLAPKTELGFDIAETRNIKELTMRARKQSDSHRQHAPLPTRIYGELINNLSDELDDIELHAPQLLAALREALAVHLAAKSNKSHDFSVGPDLLAKYSLYEYLARRGFNVERKGLGSMSAAVTELFMVCKLQIHVFSGMRNDEARMLPYHCSAEQKGERGRMHSSIVGTTTKFNKGRRLRTRWVTTARDGIRAIRLAQKFASLIYDSLGITPSKTDAHKDDYPLFPTANYFPWGTRKHVQGERIQTINQNLSCTKEALQSRIFPLIEEKDIAELEDIDPFRAWREEPEFIVGQRWSLSTHQLRRSLVVYANASGLVGLPSLRRQLQHITYAMTLYYGRGSTFCKNFIADDPDGYKKHVAVEWQDGEDEARVLVFTREVLSSTERMFGGAGTFYQLQKERGEVMSSGEVAKRIKSGLLSYRPGPLGGCTKPGSCDKTKSISMINISCATESCKNLIGKHSKILRVIQLKKAAMSRISADSIDRDMELEQLRALEGVERKWRPIASSMDNLMGPGLD